MELLLVFIILRGWGFCFVGWETIVAGFRMEIELQMILGAQKEKFRFFWTLAVEFLTHQYLIKKFNVTPDIKKFNYPLTM